VDLLGRGETKGFARRQGERRAVQRLLDLGRREDGDKARTGSQSRSWPFRWAARPKAARLAIRACRRPGAHPVVHVDHREAGGAGLEHAQDRGGPVAPNP
jgi:hypothetical protein